ncbi:carboxymuconolactone decarboxylase family protein [Nocardia sp. CNY236]|uniref:carboxymuconolactone decarboxylase family protein n=1 Tax=Nocardia sp. CNY236 TaxID=1169152 RepID=UPI0004163DFE|nr:carboxymuconolactone decarboxylase family protein [Nocardia sp. CNY236]
MHDERDRFLRGYEALCAIENTDAPSIVTGLADIAPDLARFVVEFGYGDVLTRPGLAPAERQLVTVGALTALANAAPQLAFHLHGALNVGCSPTELVEAIVHVCLYAGFPASINGLTVAKTVFAERGIRPDVTRADLGGMDRWERGLATLATVDGRAGQHVIESLNDIAPDLGRFLVEFAFGDVYPRGGLDLRQRELVTVAACTALGTVDPQLRIHIHGLLNTGGTQVELIEVIIQMALYAGFPAALNALTTAREVLRQRATDQ